MAGYADVYGYGDPSGYGYGGGGYGGGGAWSGAYDILGAFAGWGTEAPTTIVQGTEYPTDVADFLQAVADDPTADFNAWATFIMSPEGSTWLSSLPLSVYESIVSPTTPRGFTGGVNPLTGEPKMGVPTYPTTRGDPWSHARGYQINLPYLGVGAAKPSPSAPYGYGQPLGHEEATLASRAQTDALARARALLEKTETQQWYAPRPPTYIPEEPPKRPPYTSQYVPRTRWLGY